MLFQIKNNQKNVVIVPIHVQHHDSQVSQIFEPDIASDITQAQQKNFEGKKTPAQRMQEYRAWEKNYFQSTWDSTSVVHHHDDEILQVDDSLNKSREFVGLPCQVVRHQEDEILRADDSLNSSHEFVGLLCQGINATRRKTPAERMREYRRRRRNVVESELVQESKHQVPYVEGSEDASLSNYSDLYHDEYRNILRAGITRLRVFLKREPKEKWHSPFNPFVLNTVKSNIDIQFITEEYLCAQYVAM
ncbi:ATP-dependent DNA helicase [Trichonephila inaurata madagascariensis]|uniref:ATP-dependent DNA helicase n=1 Tax=Trichonephila inaurata madagascariensis TaxID=2747483 RepID=A0A8X6YSQ8_9ARAC|nr:ATP-dependent DNA helicase [Trichonephila inaurata madagascariensis]